MTSKAGWRTAIALAAAIAAGAIWFVAGLDANGGSADGGRNAGEPPTMSEEDAKILEIAMAAIGDNVDRLPDKWDVEITREGGEYVVTWPVRKAAPSIGPEFYCRVFVDRERGVVTRKVVGN